MLTVYKASAGSGKTYTLTRDYIKVLLGVQDGDRADAYRLNHPRHTHDGAVEHNRHRGILAITFTNKATEEMKKRILTELARLKANHPEGHRERCAFTDDLLKAYGCTAGELAATAATALAELLHDGANFNVSTIDSFFQQVLRSMAFELDYPGDYNIEIEGRGVVAEAINMMLDDYNRGIMDAQGKSVREDRTMKAILSDFMREEMAAGKNFNIFNRSVKVHRELIDKANSIFDEKYQQVSETIEPWLYTEGAVDRFRRELERQDEVLKEGVLEAVKSFRNALEEAGLDEGDIRGDYIKLAQKFEEGKVLGPKAYETKKAELVLDSAVPAKDSRNGFFLAAKAKDHEGENMDYLTDHIKEAFRLNSLRLGIGLALREMRVYKFMRYVKDNIERYRRENNIIVLADTNELLRRIMEGDEKIVVPFVYEKMGVQLHHFLIDEFQDTSRMQWNNLKPLLHNGLGEGHYSMIIGDEKQAIYRFRNSDSSMLRSEVQENDFPGQSEVKGNAKGENTNWRSAADIVRFNNTLFRRLAERFEISDYANVNQEISKQNREVTSYICFRENDPEDAESQSRAMLGEIRRQHASGYKWSDIAILVNTNDNAVAAASTLLSARIDESDESEDAPTIPVATDEALLLMLSPSVNFIISTMEMMLGAGSGKEGRGGRPDPQEATRRFNYLLNFEMKGEADESEAVVRALEKTFSSGEDAEGEDVGDIVEKNSATLITLVEDIMERRLSAEMRRREMIYLAAFEDCVVDYCQSHNHSLPDFLRWWEANKRKLTIASPNDVDAVRIMTIHKSKGLQFPCVHVPFAGYNLAGSATRAESVWVPLPEYMRREGGFMPESIRVTLQKDASVKFSPLKEAYEKNLKERIVDGLNKTYVAYTRAERELCVYYQSKAMKDGTTELGALLGECFGKRDPEVLDNEMDIAPHVNETSMVIGQPTQPLGDKTPAKDEEEVKVELRDYDINRSAADVLTSVDALFTFENEEDTDE